MPAGRPTKLTPELQQKIVQGLRAGGYIETVAAMNDVSKPTLYDWFKRGASRRGKYGEFLNACERAMAEAEMRAVGIVNRGAQGFEIVKKTTQIEKIDGGNKPITKNRTVEEKSTYQDPALAKWWLEHARQKTWGPRERIQISGDPDAPLEFHNVQTLGHKKEIDVNAEPSAVDREASLEFAYRKYILAPKLMPPAEAETT